MALHLTCARGVTDNMLGFEPSDLGVRIPPGVPRMPLRLDYRLMTTNHHEKVRFLSGVPSIMLPW